MRLVQCLDCQLISLETATCRSCGSHAVSYTIYLSPAEPLSRQDLIVAAKLAYCIIDCQPEKLPATSSWKRPSIVQ
jgi:hypothetical protein